MSAATLASRGFVAPCGENETRALMPSSPRSRQRVESLGPKPTTESLFQYEENASRNTRAAFSPRRTIALLAWTYSPRQVKFVEPQRTAFPASPSTTIVLLCWRLLMWCRFTRLAPAVALSRAAAAVSAEPALRSEERRG